MEQQIYCKCGKPSEIHGHGIRNGEVYSIHKCAECYNMGKRLIVKPRTEKVVHAQ